MTANQNLLKEVSDSMVVKNDLGNAHDAVERALAMPSLLDALEYVVLWEHEAWKEREYDETCFRFLMHEVMCQWDWEKWSARRLTHEKTCALNKPSEESELPTCDCAISRQHHMSYKVPRKKPCRSAD